MKPISNLLKMSALNREMTPFHFENNKTWSENNKYNVRNPSAKTNGELRLPWMPKHQKPQVMPHVKGEPQNTTLLKNKTNEPGHQNKSRKLSRPNKRDSRSPSLKKRKKIYSHQLKIAERSKIWKTLNKVMNHRHQIIITSFEDHHQTLKTKFDISH